MRIPFSTLILASFFSLASAEAPFAAGSLGVPLTDPPPGATPPPGADRPYGAVVGADAEGTSGLRPDDLIVAYNGAHVESSRALKRMVAETPAGREVEIRVIRGGTPRLLRLRLPSAPPPPTPVPGSTPEREPSAPNPRQLGARVVPLDPDIARQIEWPAGEGLQVVEVLDKTPAKRAGLLPGDLLLEIEGQSIRSPEHLLLTLNRGPRPDVELTLYRNGERYTTVLRPLPESGDR